MPAALPTPSKQNPTTNTSTFIGTQVFLGAGGKSESHIEITPCVTKSTEHAGSAAGMNPWSMGPLKKNCEYVRVQIWVFK